MNNKIFAKHFILPENKIKFAIKILNKLDNQFCLVLENTKRF